MTSLNDFVDHLTYLGASLNGETKQFDHSYVDLEGFALNATLQLDLDTRCTQAFVHWISRYGCLLSPSKMRRLIRTGSNFDPSILGVMIDLIDTNKVRLQNWSILRPFLKRARSRSLFAHLPAPRNQFNPTFLQWGFTAPMFAESSEKFLRPTAFTLSHCPELRYRAEGVSTVAADLRAFKEKKGTQNLTLYEIAKRIHHPRAQVNGFYRQLVRLNVLSD